ncbi:MAG: NFACT family protein [Candidatus Aenigmarchaeota archaeon]|nr:NFACT family protein [Candidatus Aenigmarchaeota archaeon]
MKREFSYVELTYLVQEWQDWIGARISHIVLAQGQFCFELYKTGGSRAFLNVLLPLAWIGDFKLSAPSSVPPFCGQLRKLLEGAKIQGITLLKGERIVRFDLGEYSLLFQLYGKGNLVVLKDNIVCAARYRGSVSGLQVVLREKLFIKEKNDPSALKRSDADALQGMIGKVYAKEVVLRADSSRLLQALKAVFEQESRPCVVLDKGVVVDITPFALMHYQKYECEVHKSYNEAVSSVMKRRAEFVAREGISKSFDAKLERLRSIIAAQESHLEKQKNEVKKNQETGELIYENYTAVKDVLDVLNQARKKFSWEEIRAKLKAHKLIKDVDEKNGRISVELSHQ